MKKTRSSLHSIVAVGLWVGLVTGSLTTTAVQAETPVPESAAPLLTGNTLTVSEDGWYQFQDATTFIEVCGGTFECTVTDGTYNVINHTTGQRWNNIVVTTGATPVVSAPATGMSIPVIEGLALRFPDNGWYQVQSSNTYESVCNGLSNCGVESGQYTVINHTAGQRWDGLHISEGNNTLLLPDNGWHQVQDAATFASICEGVTTCSVSNGTYIVINHTTGERYEGVDVGIVDVETPEPAAFTLSAANAEQVVQNVMSVINEDQIDTLFANAADDLLFQDRLFFITNTVDDIQFSQGVTLETPYPLETGFNTGEFTDIPIRSEYTCAAGGTIFSYVSDQVFNDCSVGNHTYNGTVGRRNDAIRGTVRNYPFWDFSATNTNGETSVITGGYSIGNISFVVINRIERWRDAEFTTVLSDGDFRVSDFTIERLDRSDVGFTLGSTNVITIDGIRYEIANNSQSASIEGSFVVQAGWTAQEAVSVAVSLGFTDTIRVPIDGPIDSYPGTIDPQEPFEWQTGSIDINAPDGSSLSVVPTTPSAQSFSIELSNGESLGPFPWADGYTVDCGSSDICGE